MQRRTLPVITAFASKLERVQFLHMRCPLMNVVTAFASKLERVQVLHMRCPLMDVMLKRLAQHRLNSALLPLLG